MENNIQQYFAEFSANAKDMAQLNFQKKQKQARQKELETILIKCLTSMQTEAVQFKDKIFSINEKKIASPLNIKKIKELMQQFGMTNDQIEAVFRLQSGVSGFKQKIIITEKPKSK